MKQLEALTVSIGVLGAVDTWLTAVVIPLPVWVTFIAWASFFVSAAARRVSSDRSTSNWVGDLIGTVTLLIIAFARQPRPRRAIVGVCSGAMIVASAAPGLKSRPRSFRVRLLLRHHFGTGHGVFGL